MNILAVDDDKVFLEKIKANLSNTEGNECFFFDSSLAALAKAREITIDVAILDIKMPELSGIDLGRYLTELNPYVNLIYLTQHTEYAFDALKLHASGYIKKPGKKDELKNELENLRYPESRKKYKRVFAQTFGDFELFVDGKPVEFKYKRSKEVIALLINNKGAQTTNGEIVANLWEDEGDPDKKFSYLRNLRQDIHNTFTNLKIDDIIVKQRGSISIVKDRIECDLYDWLENKNDSKYKYLGDYMNQYSWSEFMHAELDEISYDMWDEEDEDQ